MNSGRVILISLIIFWICFGLVHNMKQKENQNKNPITEVHCYQGKLWEIKNDVPFKLIMIKDEDKKLIPINCE